MLSRPGQRPGDPRQGRRLPVRVGDGAGDRLGLPGDLDGLLVLSRPGQRLRDPRQGLRLPLRVGDGAGDRLGLPGDPGGLLVLPRPGQRPATCARASACRSGSVMERATASACWCWPAPARASATRARASACRSGSVMERATARLPGDPGGLLVLARPGQRPRDLRQGLRLPVRVGDGAGDRLGLPGDLGGLLVLPAPASAPATRARALRLPGRVGDGAGDRLGLPGDPRPAVARPGQRRRDLRQDVRLPGPVR